jgi:hypothetical protein
MEAKDGPVPFHREAPGWFKAFVRSSLNAVGAAGMAVATGGYARWVAPFQVEYTELGMPLRGLPASFEGFRIVQICDLHTGRRTPVPYLQRVMHHVNRMPHDLVVVTGDLITHGIEWIDEACDVLGELRGPVAVSFGNHDYSRTWETWSSTEVAEALQVRLQARGLTVLRNRAMPIEHADGRIWIVGMEDLWSGRFDASEAFRETNVREPIIALSHNPDTVFELEEHGAQWILAGHTHGGQIRIPVAGAIILPVRHKRFDLGEFRVGRSRMYISRGVGFRLAVRFRCRPEVPCFVLRGVH